jgi:hypothetical protein
MAGHAKLHPYLKTFDELQRSANRMTVYLDMYKESISIKEKKAILSMVEAINNAIMEIPEQYHLTRWNQFKKTQDQ